MSKALSKWPPPHAQKRSSCQKSDALGALSRHPRWKVGRDTIWRGNSGVTLQISESFENGAFGPVVTANGSHTRISISYEGRAIGESGQ
jgi:hypothetical protein